VLNQPIQEKNEQTVRERKEYLALKKKMKKEGRKSE